MGLLLGIIKWVVIVLVVFFVVTFTMYFFNLDMKLTAALAPILEKWYDHIDRDKRL